MVADRVATGRGGSLELRRQWCTPPPIDFLHHLPNKPLTGHRVLQDLENKGDSFQDIQNIGVMGSLEL